MIRYSIGHSEPNKKANKANHRLTASAVLASRTVRPVDIHVTRMAHTMYDLQAHTLCRLEPDFMTLVRLFCYIFISHTVQCM